MKSFHTNKASVAHEMSSVVEFEGRIGTSRISRVNCGNSLVEAI